MVIIRMVGIPVILMLAFALAQGQPQAKPTPTPVAAAKAQAPPKKQTFIEWLLRFAGVTLTSSNQKGETNDEPGELWVADLTRPGFSFQVAAGNGYGWPIFLPCDTGLLALKGNEVFRFTLSKGNPQPVATIPNIYKLVGGNLDDPDKVLVVIKDESGQNKLSVFHISTRTVSPPEVESPPVSGPPSSEDERQLALKVAIGSWREYPDAELFVEKMTNEETATHWTDILYRLRTIGAGEPVNISQCGPASCSQPSRSSEGRYVGFIKKSG